MSLFELIKESQPRILKGKEASGYSKEDMGNPASLYSYIKEKVEEDIDKDGKHQYIKAFDDGLKIYISVYNTPIYWSVEETGDEITVKQFADGVESVWETRPILKATELIPVSSVEEGLKKLRSTFAEEYEDLSEAEQDFWTERAKGLNKILMQEQPMVEAYARFLWERDPKAQAISPTWIENVRDVALSDEDKRKVAPIKSRLKSKAIKQLGFDKDILRERA